MSDDPRREAADIVCSLRRYLERETPAAAELLAASAARAKAASGSNAPAGSDGDGASVDGGAKRKTASEAPATAHGSAHTAGNVVAASADEVDLFGNPVKKPKEPDNVYPDEELPPVHPPLNPAGASREEVLEASLPVLDAIAAEARACTKCGLCETRTQAVPGVGSARSGIIFVGEAPGADEDRLGEPFVGRAGELLTKIIAAMDKAKLIPGMTLSRETVYICNVLKCRPPENRNPLPHEIEACSPYLRRQLDALRPRVICCLGKFAAELLCGVKGTISSLRGKVYRYQGARLIVTYHPAALLRNPNWKRPVWEDMQFLAQIYNSDP